MAAPKLGPEQHLRRASFDRRPASTAKAIHQRMRAATGDRGQGKSLRTGLTKTSLIAEAYWFAHQQTKDGWTHELDLRPSVEEMVKMRALPDLDPVGSRNEPHGFRPHWAMYELGLPYKMKPIEPRTGRRPRPPNTRD